MKDRGDLILTKPIKIQKQIVQVREREDASNSDISPVPVSELVDDRSGKPDGIQANKNPKTNKKETTIEWRNLCGDSEIPEWLQEFK